MAFFNATLQPGLAKIAATHHLEVNVMTVTANLLPFADFSGCKVVIAVVGNTTTGNVGNNGESEFPHVMMKMIPNAYGTTVHMNDREPVTLTYSSDLSGTNIEEFNDLSVVVFLHQNGSREFYQSAYSGRDVTFAAEARCSGIMIDREPLPDFNPDVFDYTIHLPYGSSDVPSVTATGMEPNTTVVVVAAWELPGTTITDRFGEALLSHNRYTINLEIGYVGEDDPVKNESQVIVFPNPATDRVTIKGGR